MASIYARGGKLWCRLKGVRKPGAWGCAPTPFAVGDETKARRYAATAQRAIDERAAGPARDGSVRSYAATWIEQRRGLDLDWKNDRGRLKHHVLPAIGDMKLAEVRTRHIVDLFLRIRTTPRVGRTEPVSPRTVYNVYSVVSAMFRDAKLADLIEQTPCVLDERQLGPLVDSDPEWREGSVFTRPEAQTLISDARIPDDRRMVYAFGLLAGMRPGEAAALRWRHWDPAVTPLGKLTVVLAYNTRKHRAKSTKTEAVRHVPVHPTLAAMLGEWQAVGWPAMMGRPPGPDDLVVPLPPGAASARRSRAGEPFRGHDYSGKRWREQDLPALGWRYREPYATKSTFITLVLDDGADPHVIETRVTHTKKSRSAFDGYNRGRQWEITCTEVAKLRLARLVGHPGPLATGLATVAESSSRNAVEAAGVEGHARYRGSARVAARPARTTPRIRRARAAGTSAPSVGSPIWASRRTRTARPILTAGSRPSRIIARTVDTEIACSRANVAMVASSTAGRARSAASSSRTTRRTTRSTTASSA